MRVSARPWACLLLASKCQHEPSLVCVFQFQDEFAATTMLGRAAEPREIAHACLCQPRGDDYYGCSWATVTTMMMMTMMMTTTLLLLLWLLLLLMLWSARESYLYVR